MTNSSRENPVSQSDSLGKFYCVALPVILSAACLLLGLFFMMPVLGDPDSYREALSAIRYVEEGKYGSYWDHALTMYFFVAATHLAFIFGFNQITVLNALAALFASLSIWPFYQFVRRLVNWQTAASASAALILSPVLIRLSSYLSHDGIGYVFALWSIYLFECAVSRNSRALAFAFGLVFAATWTARPNEALFIGLPLLALLLQKTARPVSDLARKQLPFALLGFFLILLLVYRPVLVFQLVSKADTLFSGQYFFGRYFGSTTRTALQALTPALVALTLAGLLILIAFRKRFIALFCALWIFPVYVFYSGMGCRHRYFLAVLAPCILLCFAAADSIDARFPPGRMRRLHAAKIIALVFLVGAALGPNISDLFWFRNSRDSEIIAREIGKIVKNNLLLTTSLGPMIDYYNREQPPQIIYLLASATPDTIEMGVDKVHLAQQQLRLGYPVFATNLVVQHLQFAGFDVGCERVWEHESIQLFRLTRLIPGATGTVGIATRD